MMSNDGFGKIKQKKVQFSGKPYQRSESKQPPKDDSSFLGRVKGTLKSLLAPSWFVAKSTAPPQTNASSGALLEQLTAPPLNAGEDLRTPSSSKKPEQNDVSGAHGPHRGAPGTPHPYQITTHRFISPEHRPVPQRPAAQVPYLTHLGGQRIGNSPDPFAAPVASRLPDIRVSAPQEPPDPHLGGSVEPPDPRPGFSGEPDRAPLRTPSRTREPEAEGLDDSNISQSSFLRKVDPRHNVSEPVFRSRVSAWDTSDVASSSVAAPSPGPSASKPSFNISLFANSRLVNDQTVSMLGLDPQRSGYYPGKTVFGGASAHRKTRLQPGQPYSRTVGMRKMEAKTSPNNPGGTVTSSTARKILDALDGMSSVLGDAKKVPLNTSSMMDSPMPYTTRGYGRPGSSRRQQSVGTPPLGRLSTPGAARIAANRDQLTLRQTADVSGRSRQMPSTSMPAPVTSTPVLPRSGKIRREKSGLHYKSSRDDEPDYAEPPDLPQPTFHLPVPQNFILSSFTTPKPASSQSEAGAGSFVQSRLRTAGVGQSSGQSASPFRFATPMMNTPPTEDESVQVPNQNFKFSSPMAVSQATDNGPIPHNDGSGFSASKARQKPGPTVQPLVAVPGPVLGAPSPVMKSGSVLDALGGGSSRKVESMHDRGSLEPSSPTLLAEAASKVQRAVHSVQHVAFPPSANTGMRQDSSIVKTPIDVSGRCRNVHELVREMNLSESQIREVCLQTILQSESEAWHKHRIGRITASMVRRVCTRTDTIRRKPGESPDSLVHAVMRYKPFFQTAAMKHGIESEPRARAVYTELMKGRHEGFQVENSGLVIDVRNQHLACSPDLLVSCQCHGNGLCEIKCPQVNSAANEANYSRHLEASANGPTLKKNSEYFSQVQFQMGITGRKYCDFFVFSLNEEYFVERIEFDAEFFETMVEKATFFWEKFVAPEMLSGRLLAEMRSRKKIETTEAQPVGNRETSQSCSEAVKWNPESSSGFSASPFHFDASKARQKPGPTVQPPVAVPGPVFGAPSPVMKSGSVLDALGGGTKSAPVNDVGSLFKPPSVCNSTSLTDNQWSCSKCKNLNSAVKNSCSQCGKSKVDNQARMKNDLSIAEKFKPKTGTWECGTCMVQNKSESETCVCCSAAKPKTNSGTDNMKVIVGNTQQAGKWECPVCMIFNENSISSCAACQAAKPGKKDMGSSQWECPTCWIQNEESASQCVACSAANPKKSGTSVTSQSLADKFKKPSGSWECDTCMVFNESSAVKCVACETPRPGSTSTSGFSKPTYQFGSAGAGGFKCSTGGAQNGGFTFGGQKLDSAPKVDAPSSGFKFAGGTGTGGFKFGGDTSSKPSVGFSLAKPDDSEQKKPVSSGFTFGGTKDSNSGSGFTFVGDKKESTSVPNSGFSFSTQVVNSSEKTETKPELKTPSFQFGEPASDDSKPKTGLSFSLPKTEDSKKEESESGFSLKPASSTATDLPSTNSITGLFKFGKMASDTKSDPKPPDQKPTFSFGAPASSAPTATVTPTVLGAPADKAPSTLGAPSAFTGFGAPSAAKNELAVVGTKRKTSSEEPAAKKSVGATPFSFSAAPVSTTSATPISAVFGASTSAPSFGAPASKPAFGAPSATPAFGAPSSTPSFGAPSTTTPSFGAPTATPSFGQTAPSAFGASVFGNSSETPAFGAKPSAAAAPLGGATGSSAGFNFSAAAQPTTGGAFSGGFNFGAAATATPAAGVFQFGAQPAAPTATPAAPAAFNFTAGATPTFSGGSTPSFTAGPAPTFNAGPAPNTNAGGAFMFSGSQPAAPMAGANPFNAAPASTIAQRKIKKATRRR